MIEILNGILGGSSAAVELFIAQPALFFDAAPGEITNARARSLIGVALALISVITALAFMRSFGGKGKIGSAVAMVLGVIALAMSAVHLAGSTGFGTGGGRAGAIVAAVLAVIGIGLGALAGARSRGRKARSELST